MDILDDVMGNVDNVGVDIHDEKNSKNSLLGFSNGKV